MKLAKFAAALAALSLTAVPLAAQTAGPPAPRDGSAVASDSENLRGGFIIPVIAIIAVILGILALTGGNNDRPHSP